MKYTIAQFQVRMSETLMVGTLELAYKIAAKMKPSLFYTELIPF